MRKIINIEARKKFNNKDINFSELNRFKGKTISIASTVQYLDFIPKIKQYFEKNNQKIIIKQGAYYKAHVLGCNPLAFDKNADIFLLLADGKFHALNNAVLLGKEIYVFNLKTLDKVTTKEIEKIKLRTIAKQKKFLSSDKIGLLVSTKIGQKYKQIKKLKQKTQKLNKQVYVFESDKINLQELENFPIQIWINTACPGLGIEDPRVVNLRDVLEFIK